MGMNAAKFKELNKSIDELVMDSKKVALIKAVSENFTKRYRLC